MTLRSAAPALCLLALLAFACGGCASRSGAGEAPRAAALPAATATVLTATTTQRRPSSLPVVSEPGTPGPQWREVATVAGAPAAWISARSGVTLLRLDQHLVRLVLHAGSAEPEGAGWPHGSKISARERGRVVAGLNGGFKLGYGEVGFMAGGRVAAPLAPGLGSIVTYEDGGTEIGSWRRDVPASGRPIASVLQDLHLLLDGGAPAANLESCAISCWGATLGGGVDVARSALGITADGELVWAAGERLSPAQLANGLVSAAAQRAVELDINPEWVAGYLYRHRAGGPVPVPLVPGQAGIPGQLLSPYSRDFFTVIAR